MPGKHFVSCACLGILGNGAGKGIISISCCDEDKAAQHQFVKVNREF
jgi:hypothetical protein